MRLRVIVGGSLAVVTLLAGCAAPPAPPPAPATTAPLPSHPGGVTIVGAVHTPATITPEQLAAMPATTVTVRFGTEKGTEQHTETGVPVFTLLQQAGPALTPGRKHDELSIVVLVAGSDGYRAALSYGELAPNLGNDGALLATTQDGVRLPGPRLVLPHDVKGARYVSGVVELNVQHLD